jgi:DNA-binding HxlR family transcriptional regulator
MDGSEAWRDVPTGKGSLHLIAALGEEPRRFTDLEEHLPISSRMLANRLEAGVRLEVFQLDRLVDEEGDRKVYRLDRAGERVLNVMQRHDAAEAALLVPKHQATVDEVQVLLIDRLESEE